MFLWNPHPETFTTRTQLIHAGFMCPINYIKIRHVTCKYIEMYTIFNTQVYFLKPAMWAYAYTTATSGQTIQWSGRTVEPTHKSTSIHITSWFHPIGSVQLVPSGLTRPTGSNRLYQPVGLNSKWPTGWSKNNHTKPVIVQIFFNFVGLNRHQQHKNRLRVAPTGLHLKQGDGSPDRVSK